MCYSRPSSVNATLDHLRSHAIDWQHVAQKQTAIVKTAPAWLDRRACVPYTAINNRNFARRVYFAKKANGSALNGNYENGFKQLVWGSRFRQETARNRIAVLLQFSAQSRRCVIFEQRAIKLISTRGNNTREAGIAGVNRARGQHVAITTSRRQKPDRSKTVVYSCET